MPRTFTLSRLMAGITAFCIVCGLAANFPEAATFVAAVLLVLAPTIVVFLISARFSRDPAPLGCLIFSGAVFSLLLVPGVRASGGGWWADAVANYLIVAGPPTICALLLALPFVLSDLWARHSDPPRSQP